MSTESRREPPTVKDVSLSTSRPFVGIEERHESRREHRNAGVITLGLSMLLLLVPTLTVGSALTAAMLAFAAGYNLHSWAVYPTLYEGDE